jgi:hypothetical protein
MGMDQGRLMQRMAALDLIEKGFIGQPPANPMAGPRRATVA